MCIKCSELIYDAKVVAFFFILQTIDFLISDNMHKRITVLVAYIFPNQCDQQDRKSRLLLMKGKLNC